LYSFLTQDRHKTIYTMDYDNARPTGKQEQTGSKVTVAERYTKDRVTGAVNGFCTEKVNIRYERIAKVLLMIPGE